MEGASNQPGTSGGAGRPSRIYQIKMTLKHIRPPIWRRMHVADDTPLVKLHKIFQIVMGWENYHLHAFLVDDLSYGPHDPYLDDEYKDERKFTLRDIAEGVHSTFCYQYDFGYDWMHDVEVEEIVEPTAKVKFPLCVGGKRACPPEDSGSFGGYDRFLEAIGDPNHPEHKELKDWVGREFNPEEFNLNEVNAALRRLDDKGSSEESD